MTRDPLGAGLIEIDLPFGGRVRGVRPTLGSLARDGLLPSHLLEAAGNFADPAWFTDAALSDEERDRRSGQWVEATHCRVAAFIRDVWDDDAGGWVKYELPIEERLARMPRGLVCQHACGTADVQVDPLDYDLLEDLVLRLRTPEEVRAMARLIRIGSRTNEEAEPPESADATFREEPSGAADRPTRTSRPSGVPSKDVPGGRRRRPGVSARRGPDGA